jgi:hypothetical protein
MPQRVDFNGDDLTHSLVVFADEKRRQPFTQGIEARRHFCDACRPLTGDLVSRKEILLDPLNEHC